MRSSADVRQELRGVRNITFGAALKCPQRYAGEQTTLAEYRQSIGQLAHVRQGRKFSHDEMNERWLAAWY